MEGCKGELILMCVCVCVRVLACLFESCWLLFLKSQSFPRTWISNYATLRWRTFAVSVGLRWTRSIMMEPANRIHHGCCFKRQPLHVVLCPCVHPAVDRTPLLSGGSNTQPSSLAICSNITSPRAHSFASKCLRLCVCVCVCLQLKLVWVTRGPEHLLWSLLLYLGVAFVYSRHPNHAGGRGKSAPTVFGSQAWGRLRVSWSIVG